MGDHHAFNFAERHRDFFGIWIRRSKHKKAAANPEPHGALCDVDEPPTHGSG
jgi:hypothetical protein